MSMEPGNDDQTTQPIFQIFSRDILTTIFHFLDANSLLIAQRVCRQWKGVINQDLVWKRLCQRTQPGVAEIIHYRLSLKQSKKRKLDSSEWKEWFLWYNSKRFFCNLAWHTREESLSEIQLGMYHMGALVLNNLAVNPAQLLWLYSVVHTSRTSQTDPDVKHFRKKSAEIYTSATSTLANLLLENMTGKVANSTEESVDLLNSFVEIFQKYRRFGKLLTKFMRPALFYKKIHKMDRISQETFKETILQPIISTLSTAAFQLSTVPAPEIQALLQEVGKILNDNGFGEVAESFVVLPPPIEEKEEELRDGVIVSGVEAVILMSTALRDMFTSKELNKITKPRIN